MLSQASERLCSPPQKPLWASLSSRGEVIYHIIPHCCAPSHCLAIQVASVLPEEGLPHGGQLKGPIRGSCWIQEMKGGRNASSHCPKPHAVWWHGMDRQHCWKLMQGQVGRSLRWHKVSLGFLTLIWQVLYSISRGLIRLPVLSITK